MKPLVIWGAGGQAVDTILTLHELNRQGFNRSIAAFIDINPGEISVEGITYPVWAETDFLPKRMDYAHILGTGDPLLNQSLTKRIGLDAEFPNIIDPRCIVPISSVQFGMGNFIAPHCVLSARITIGNFNIFNVRSIIGHDDQIGDWNVFNPGAVISGDVHIGSTNLLGSQCTILQSLTIGNQNRIGAGAVLTKSVSDNLTLVGVPAVARR